MAPLTCPQSKIIESHHNFMLTNRVVYPSRMILSLSLLGCLLAGLATQASAQVPSEPRRQQLLNGLRVLIWQRPGDQTLLLKLRIHSGAAFDLEGKEGTMALLGDLLFPDPVSREYFTEEMDGYLEVRTNYDSITISMKGRPSGLEQIIEILRTALVTTQLTPENIAKVQEGRIKIIRETSISPSILADRAIASRLFGDFPYGRPAGGSAESLARVERADLMLAQERFLNSNNATLVVIGGVEPPRVMRALRQLLGGWRKSEKIVPTTFRQPEPPDPRPLLVNIPAGDSAEIRLATRGLARADTDTPAANVLSLVARKRWEALVPELTRGPVFVRHQPNVLPGIFVFGATVDNSLAVKALEAARNVTKSLVDNPVSVAELEQAKAALVVEITKSLSDDKGIAIAWVDVDTYRLSSIQEQLRRIQAVTAMDVQRTAGRLFRNASASVVMGNSEILRPQLEQAMTIEVLGEIAEPAPASPESKAPPTPSKDSRPE